MPPATQYGADLDSHDQNGANWQLPRAGLGASGQPVSQTNAQFSYAAFYAASFLPYNLILSVKHPWRLSINLLPIAALVGLLALSYWVWLLQQRITRALGGGQQNLESNLERYYDEVKELTKQQSSMTSKLQQLQDQANLASQKISVVRFNPFGDTGGDQSFSLAVLDAQDSGYVVTSIHGRQGTRVYIKPVDFGKSKYKLSVEEQRALKQASQRVPAEERN